MSKPSLTPEQWEQMNQITGVNVPYPKEWTTQSTAAPTPARKPTFKELVYAGRMSITPEQWAAAESSLVLPSSLTFEDVVEMDRITGLNRSGLFPYVLPERKPGPAGKKPTSVAWNGGADDSIDVPVKYRPRFVGTGEFERDTPFALGNGRTTDERLLSTPEAQDLTASGYSTDEALIEGTRQMLHPERNMLGALPNRNYRVPEIDPTVSYDKQRPIVTLGGEVLTGEEPGIEQRIEARMGQERERAGQMALRKQVEQSLQKGREDILDYADQKLQGYVDRMDEGAKKRSWAERIMIGFAKNKIETNPELLVRDEFDAARATRLQGDILQGKTKKDKEEGDTSSGIWSTLGTGSVILDVATPGTAKANMKALLNRALYKASRGEQLTPAEQSIIDTHRISGDVQKYIEARGGLTTGAQIGKNIGESLPFLRDFAMTGGLGGAAGKAAVGALVRTAAGKYLKKAAQKGLEYAISSAVMTPLQSGTYENYLDRTIDQYRFAEDGSIEKFATPAFARTYKALAESFNEVFSEHIGAGLGKGVGWMLRAPARKISKVLGHEIAFDMAFGGYKRNFFIDFLRNRLGWQGTFQEFFEEIYTGITTPLFTGEPERMKDFWVEGNWWKTFLTVGTMGAGFMVLDAPAAVGYGAQIHKYRRIERNSLASIDNLELRGMIYNASHKPTLWEQSEALSKIDWKSFNLSLKDASHVADYLFARAAKNIFKETGRAMDATGQFYKELEESVYSRLYCGVDGTQPTRQIVLCETNEGGPYAVLSGDYEGKGPDNMLIVSDAEGEKKTIPLSSVKSFETRNADDYLSMRFAEITGSKQSGQQLEDAEEEASVASEAGIDPQQAASVIAQDIGAYEPGEEVQLTDGRKAIVSQRLADGYMVQDETGAFFDVAPEDIAYDKADMAEETLRIDRFQPQEEATATTESGQSEAPEESTAEGLSGPGVQVPAAEGAAGDTPVFAEGIVDDGPETLPENISAEVGPQGESLDISAEPQEAGIDAESETQAADPLSGGEPQSSGTQWEELPEVPTTKDGTPDFTRMSPIMLGNQVEKLLGSRTRAYEALRGMAEDNSRQIEKLQAKVPTKAEAWNAYAKKIADLQREAERLGLAMERYSDLAAPVPQAGDAASGVSESPGPVNEASAAALPVATLSGQGPAGKYLPESALRPQSTTKSTRSAQLESLGDYVSIDDVILRDIASGGVKFIWKDQGVRRGLATELGFADRPGEQQARLGILNSKEGVTPEEYAEHLYHTYGRGNEGGTGVSWNLDDTEIKNRVLDILMTATSQKIATERAVELHKEYNPYEGWDEEDFAEKEADDRRRIESEDEKRNRRSEKEFLENWAHIVPAEESGEYERNFIPLEHEREGQDISYFAGESASLYDTSLIPFYAGVPAQYDGSVHGIAGHDSYDQGREGIPRGDSRVTESEREIYGDSFRGGMGYVHPGAAVQGVETARRGPIPHSEETVRPGRHDTGKRFSPETEHTTEGSVGVNVGSFREGTAGGDGVGNGSIPSGVRERDGRGERHDAEREVAERAEQTTPDAMFREGEDSRAVNFRFNEELDRQISGELPEGHIYRLGRPSEALLSAGIPDLPIELSAERLKAKASVEYEGKHPFALESIRNLPDALSRPIAVFDARKKNGGKVVLTELHEGGNNFVVAMQVRKSDDVRTIEVEVNDIRSLYPKDRKNGIIAWINGGLLKWVDKKKAYDYISTQWPNYIGGGNTTEGPESFVSDAGLGKRRSHSADVAIPDNGNILSATKIIQNFENPSIVEGKIVAAAETLATELNTPLEFVREVGEISDRDGLRQKRKRRSKGWYEPFTGKVVIVIPNNTGISDVQATVLHEVVGHKGLRGALGDRFEGFLDKVYASLESAEKENIDRTVSEQGRTDSWARRTATEEYLAGLAERDAEPGVFARIIGRVREILREILHLPLRVSDADIAYMLWKSKHRLQKGADAMQVVEHLVRDRELREKLHAGEDALFRDATFEPTFPAVFDAEQSEQMRLPEDDTQASALAAEMKELRKKVARLEKVNDKLTDKHKSKQIQTRQQAKKVIDEHNALFSEAKRQIKESITPQLAKIMGKREFNSLLAAITDIRSVKALRKATDRITDVAAGLTIRYQSGQFEKLLQMKADDRQWLEKFVKTHTISPADAKKLFEDRYRGENARGVSVARMVDDATRVTMEYVRDNIRSVLQTDAEGNSPLAAKRDELESKRAMAEQGGGQLGPSDEARLVAVSLLEYYRDNVAALGANIRELTGQRKEATEKLSDLRQSSADKAVIECRQEGLEAIESELRRNKADYADALSDFNAQIKELLMTGRSKLREFKEQENRERENLVQMVFEGASDKQVERMHVQDSTQGRKFANHLNNLFASHLYSLSFTLKTIDKNAPGGMGELYERIMTGENGYVTAADNFYGGLRLYIEELNVMAARIFGKEYAKNGVIKLLRETNKKELKGATLEERTYGKPTEVNLTVGSALYIRALNKQDSGAKSLRSMGISQADVDRITDALYAQAPKIIQFADWVQEEFLPSKREKYNEVHLKVFGTQMREEENYFPIRRRKSDVSRKVDGREEMRERLPSTLTGSIINRVPNNVALDISANFFEVLLGHGQQMEHWAAFTPAVKNMNALLSNTAVRKLLSAGDRRTFEHLKTSAEIASGQYLAKTNKLNDTLAVVSKALAASKITLRLFTAIKQLASAPAFYGYSADPKFAAILTKHLVNPLAYREAWAWGMKNLPQMHERWHGRLGGDEKLAGNTAEWLESGLKKIVKYGFTPNAFVDAVTCCIGAKAVYEYELKRGSKLYSPEEAERLARAAATISFNETQQSAEGAYLSQIQKDRDLLSVCASMFNNATFGYNRKMIEGIQELRRDPKKEIEYLTKRYIKRGMETETAAKQARRDVRIAKYTAGVRIGLFGVILQIYWNLFSKAWQYIWGDPEDKDVLQDIKDGALVGPFRGFVWGNVYESVLNGYDFEPVMLVGEVQEFLRDAKNNEENHYVNTANVTALLGLAASGVLGINFETFERMYHGLEGMIRDGMDVEDVMNLTNAPKLQTRLIAGRKREDETLEEYNQRVGFIYRATNRKYDPKRDNAYEQSRRRGAYRRMGIGRQAEQVDERYRKILQECGLAIDGDEKNNAPPEYEPLREDIKDSVKSIYEDDKGLRPVYSDGEYYDMYYDDEETYADELLRLHEQKQEVIRIYEENKL